MCHAYIHATIVRHSFTKLIYIHQQIMTLDGKPMKSRILSVAIALSLLAVVFTIVPQDAEAAVYFTGTVQTTDDEGNPQDVFISGEQVYVLVETFYKGNLSAVGIRVDIQETDGDLMERFSVTTDDPEDGVYESWAASPVRSLSTGFWFDGEAKVYDVVVEVDNNETGGWTEVARTSILVRNEGLTLEPPPWDSYYPGQAVQVTIVTSNTDDLFYVQVVNDTFEEFENWTRLDTADGWYSFVWVVKLDMPDGDYTMNVRAQDNDATWYSESFSIQKYVLLVDSSQYYLLPGDTVTIIYDVVDIATLSSYEGATITYTVWWLNESGNETHETGELFDSSGTYEFDIPLDIALYSDIRVYFWANESDERTAEYMLEFTIGTIGADLTVDDGPHIPGDTVSVEVEAWIGDDDWWNPPDALAGAEVDITVEKNGTVMLAYGVSGLITDVTGVILYEFDLSTGATKGTYIVTATVSKLGYEVVRMATFEVEWDGELTVTFGKDYYYSGQTATFSFKVVWNNVELDANSVYYMVYDDYGMVATGNTSSGEGAYEIEPDYVGEIAVQAVTVYDGYFLNGGDVVDVYMADVVVFPMDEYYRAGDTIVFIYQIITEKDNATVSYAITDEDGVRVAEGDLPFALAGSFEFAVPLVSPSGEYTARIAVDDGAGHVVSDTATAWLFAEYEIQIWVESSAGFTSRAFEPGTTVVFGYKILNVGVAHLDVYRISFYASTDWIDHNMLVSSPTGTFEFEVPDSAGDGTYWMYAYLVNPVDSDLLSSDSASFAVKSEQSVWDKSVGGLSLFNVLVLILLLVMVILLIVVPFLKGRMGAEQGPPPRSMEAVEPEPMPVEPEVPPPS
jgi:hypothetical protein